MTIPPAQTAQENLRLTDAEILGSVTAQIEQLAAWAKVASGSQELTEDDDCSMTDDGAGTLARAHAVEMAEGIALVQRRKHFAALNRMAAQVEVQHALIGQLGEALENAVSALESWKISPTGGLPKMREALAKARGEVG